MATEDELRDALNGSFAPNRVDAGAVVRRSRVRRLPQQVLAGTGGVLAVAGIAFFGIQSAQFGHGSGGTAFGPVAEDSELSQDGGDSAAVKRLPADRINVCGAEVAEPMPGPSGLQTSVIAPAEASAGAEPFQVTVRIINTGSEPVRGTAGSPPAITIAQDGIVLWHSNGAVDMSALRIDLEPGQTLDLSATVLPVRCEPEDDAREQFRDDLPALPPGSYQVSAVIDFGSDAPTATTELELVMGPASELSLR